MTDAQQKIIDNATLGDLRHMRDDLNDQLGAIESEMAYLSNYRKKHPIHNNESETEYCVRMMTTDKQNPIVFFKNVYKLHIEAKNRQ